MREVTDEVKFNNKIMMTIKFKFFPWHYVDQLFVLLNQYEQYVEKNIYDINLWHDHFFSIENVSRVNETLKKLNDIEIEWNS